MNKPKSAVIKKTLVRNPEQPTPKTISVTQSKTSQKSITENSASSLEKTSKTSLPKSIAALKSTKFNTPELYSTLKVSKKIDEVVKPRKTKSLSDVDKSKLAVDEKVSRKVNFPYGQQVFKDLIPLTNHEVKPSLVMGSRGPILQKDKEPVLADFLETRKPKVYYHLPNSGLKSVEEAKSIMPATYSLRLYKILQIDDKTM